MNTESNLLIYSGSECVVVFNISELISVTSISLLLGWLLFSLHLRWTRVGDIISDTAVLQDITSWSSISAGLHLLLHVLSSSHVVIWRANNCWRRSRFSLVLTKVFRSRANSSQTIVVCLHLVFFLETCKTQTTIISSVGILFLPERYRTWITLHQSKWHSISCLG